MGGSISLLLQRGSKLVLLLGSMLRVEQYHEDWRDLEPPPFCTLLMILNQLALETEIDFDLHEAKGRE